MKPLSRGGGKSLPLRTDLALQSPLISERKARLGKMEQLTKIITYGTKSVKRFVRRERWGNCPQVERAALSQEGNPSGHDRQDSVPAADQTSDSAIVASSPISSAPYFLRFQGPRPGMAFRSSGVRGTLRASAHSVSLGMMTSLSTPRSLARALRHSCSAS